jgi:hypothetical protein
MPTPLAAAADIFQTHDARTKFRNNIHRQKGIGKPPGRKTGMTDM